MKSEGILATIEIKAFFDIIGGTLKEIFKKNEKAHDRYIKKEEGQKN